MIICGNALTELRKLRDESIQMCVTSPPYWGLRDYGIEGQLGLEKTPEEYVAKLVEIFREVRRALRKDGILWMNLGDSYYNYRGANNRRSDKDLSRRKTLTRDYHNIDARPNEMRIDGLKGKDLIGIPWRVAFALQADGWWLRQDIIWSKPNPMPESVTDRCTKAHEYIFLLSKSAKYYFDQQAVKESVSGTAHKRQAKDGRPPSLAFKMQPVGMRNRNNPSFQSYMKDLPAENGRNIRSVWTIATKPMPKIFGVEHFATFPPSLVEPMIKAGTSEKGCCPECGSPWERMTKKDNPSTDGKTSSAYAVGMTANRLAMKRQAARERGEEFVNRIITTGWRPICVHNLDPIPCIVLDPFFGAGTTGLVALKLGRDFIGIDLSEKYCKMAERRIYGELGAKPMSERS